MQTVSKIVRFLGKTVTEKVFLQHFSRLCSDVSFQVRRACASNFGEICSVVGQELTESVLVSFLPFRCPCIFEIFPSNKYTNRSLFFPQLPHFKSLCEDGIWGVRKACADVFVPVSCVCSKEVRRNVLAPLFVSFLCDQYKWVCIEKVCVYLGKEENPLSIPLFYS